MIMGGRSTQVQKSKTFCINSRHLVPSICKNRASPENFCHLLAFNEPTHGPNRNARKERDSR